MLFGRRYDKLGRGGRFSKAMLKFARLIQIMVATLTVAAVASIPLAERGSFPLRELVVPGPEQGTMLAPRVMSPLWTQPLDTSSPLEKVDFPEPALAVGTDQIVFRSEGHICAFRIVNGRRRWCSGAGDHPVFGGNLFAYITDNNAIEAVDAETGAHRWTFRFHIDPKLTLPGARTFVWSFSNKFVAASYARSPAGHEPYAVVSAAGKMLWNGSDQSAVHGPLVELSPGRVLVPQQASGAILVTPWRLLHLEPSAFLGASFWSATAFLGRRGGLVFADPNLLAPMDERLTSFHVRIDEESGRTVQNRRFAPRLVTPQSDGCATTCEGEAIAIDRTFVYGRIHDVLYRFSWNKYDADSSVSLGEATSFAGRTSGGALIVTRAIGTWLIDSTKNAVRSHQLSTKNVILHRQFAELDVLGFAGGEVIVLDDRQHVVARRSGCSLLDAARVDTRVVLACGAPNARVDVVALGRYKGPRADAISSKRNGS